MSTPRPFRPALDHVARLLMFMGIASLLAGFPLLSRNQNPEATLWLVAAFCLWILGFVAQRFSTPVPLEPVPTPPGWHWMFFSIVLLPMIGTWFDWNGPWVWIPVVFAVTVGGWAAYLPEHRRRIIIEQYQARETELSASSSA